MSLQRDTGSGAGPPTLLRRGHSLPSGTDKMPRDRNKTGREKGLSDCPTHPSCPDSGKASLLSSAMKPYLAYYDNLKKLPDYSLGNPICFLCKEETILFSVWEVGTFHLS